MADEVTAQSAVVAEAVEATPAEPVVSESPSGEVGESTASSPEAVVEAPPVPDWKEQLRKADLDELFNLDPRLSGRAGQIADRLAEQRIQAERVRIEQEIKTRTERESEARRLAELRERDLVAWDEEDRKRQQREADQQSVGQRELAARAQALTDVDREVFYSIANEVPSDLRAEIARKQYGSPDGSPHEARLEYLKDVLQQVRVDERRKVETEWQTKIEKEYRPAIEREIRASLLGQDHTPDVTPGAASNGALTVERWLEMSFEEREELRRNDPGGVDKMIATSSRGR